MTKTRKFLIATHGALAQGMLSSLHIIIGVTENIELLPAYLDESKPLEEELDRLFGTLAEGEEWVVFSDLLGGSVTNKLVQATAGKPVHIVAGFNLPLVIEVVLSDPETPIDEILEPAILRAKDQLVYVNALLSSNNPANDKESYL
jgi:fructoselysine and glucoselysine-specific PTS system IIA component